MLQTLLRILTPERQPVQKLWHELGITRADLEQLINSHRDDLATAGILLHTATTSQASKTHLYIEADERRIAALSRPETHGIARQIITQIERLGASAEELAAIRTGLDQLAQAQGNQTTNADSKTYRQEYVKCGKPTCTKCTDGPGHGPYWYAYKREGTKVKKTYIGKNKPA